MPKHLALPIRVTGSGSLHALEQDSDREIAQSVALLLSTRPGERRHVPGYGLEDPIGTGIDEDAIAAALAEFEERAEPADALVIAEGLSADRRRWQQTVEIYPSNRTTDQVEEGDV